MGQAGRNLAVAEPYDGFDESSDAPEAAPVAPLVSFRNVAKTYDGRQWIVHDLNIDVRQGEFLTLLGPSGSGKTTTLMMLAGFEYPSRGRIELRGQAIERHPPEKRNIGVVFQNYALFPHMTVAENIAFPLRVRRVSRRDAKRRVAAVLETVQLERFGDRRPTELSGGQQQRVALARALVFEPQLVLMDEPLGALDKNLREDLQLEIKHLHERLGITVVYVTHDQSEALTMSDRIAVFNDGRIQQLGAPREIYDSPVNSFVATFIGENNVIRGRVEAVEGATAAVRLPGGTLVRARATPHAAAGAEAAVAVRPEKVVINPIRRLDNHLGGTIREVIYVGEQFRIHIEFAPGQFLAARVPNTHQTPHLAIGASVTLGWRQADCWTLDAVLNG